MKIIQTIRDIELLKTENQIPIELMEEIEQDFLDMYEAESNEVPMSDYSLPFGQALFVFEKGDDVLGILNHPFALEYVEKIEIDGLVAYRCADRDEHDFQLYYSIKGMHEKETEEWLHEQANWNERDW